MLHKLAAWLSGITILLEWFEKLFLCSWDLAKRQYKFSSVRVYCLVVYFVSHRKWLQISTILYAYYGTLYVFYLTWSVTNSFLAGEGLLYFYESRITPAGWYEKMFVYKKVCLFVMRLIYNSRLEMYFLNLLLFTQPSAVSVTAAICVDS